MDAVSVRKEYLEWLCRLVNAGEKWHLLWYKLHHMAFVWTIDRDENRAEDGEYLRYLYALERGESGLSEEEISEYLGGPCTVMEFLVGLARRIEDDIMYSADEEDRSQKWFWMFIENLGLEKFDDKHYDEVEIDGIVNRFMTRKYGKNGEGNIFKKWANWTDGPENLEIWSQVHQWSNSL